MKTRFLKYSVLAFSIFTTSCIIAVPTNSTSSGWSQSARDVYTAACPAAMKSSLKDSGATISDASIQSICSCTLDKAQKLSSDPSMLSSKDAETIGSDCAKEVLGIK